MPQYILDMLDEKGIAWSLHSSIEEVMAEVDILYMTRVRKRASGPVRVRQRESAVCSSRQQYPQRQSQYESAASAAAC